MASSSSSTPNQPQSTLFRNFLPNEGTIALNVGGSVLRTTVQLPQTVQDRAGQQQLVCEHCGDPFKELRGLRGHEIHCKKNPNRKPTKERVVFEATTCDCGANTVA